MSDTSNGTASNASMRLCHSRAARLMVIGLLSAWVAGCGGGSRDASTEAPVAGTPTTPPATPPAPPPAPPPVPAAPITWADPAPINWGTALSSAQLNAKANVPGAFTYSPATGAKLEVGVQSLSVTFTPQDGTKYATSTAVRKLTVNKAEPPVRWDVPSAVLQGSTLTPAQITTTPYALYGIRGTADPASYMTVDGRPLDATTASKAGTAIIQATFVPTDSAHYRSSIVSTALTIKPASTTAAIDFGAPRQTIQGFGGSAA